MTTPIPPLPELEGPGSEERLETLRLQFAKISGRNVHPIDEALRIIYGAAIFVAIVVGARLVIGALL
jgi:hypothetical protein